MHVAVLCPSPCRQLVDPAFFYPCAFTFWPGRSPWCRARFRPRPACRSFPAVKHTTHFSEEKWGDGGSPESLGPDLNRQPAHYRCAALPLSYHGIFLCTFHIWVSKIPGAVFWRFVEIAQLLTVLARLLGAAGFSPLLLRAGAAFAFPLGDVACRATFLLVHGAEDPPFDPVLYSPVHPDQ